MRDIAAAMRAGIPCFNDCNQRGLCLSGLCACEPPFHGIDCTDSSDNGYIFVLSPPTELGLARQRLYENRTDPAYSSEDIFMRRLMSDYSMRTLRRDQALLYYLPSWIIHHYDSGNIVYEKAVDHFNSLVAGMRRADANGGFEAMWSSNRSKFVVYMAGDKGACLLPRGPIYMSHWGLTVPWKAMALPHLWKANHLKGAPASEPPCADSRDVIVPSVVPRLHMDGSGRDPPPIPGSRHAASGGGADGGGSIRSSADGKRRWLCEVFFSGGTAKRRGSWCDDGEEGGVICYSQGVRLAMFAHHANQTGSGFCLAGRAPDDYFRRSRFCLAPSGEGFGNRLMLAMAAGCVPLIIQPSLRMPFDDVLPYEAFYVRVGADAIPRLPALLAAVSDAEHARMRAAVRAHAPCFDWSPHGQAYAVARYSLCLRVGSDRSCDALRPAILRHGAARVWAPDGGGASRTRSTSGAAYYFADGGPGRIDESQQRVKGGVPVPSSRAARFG